MSATLDLCTRKIVAWNILETLETSLCTTTLQMALERERPDTHALIHHSDRGVQYASLEFRSQLALSRITQSMSRKGNCYDNAFMESFWATFKSDCLYDRPVPAPHQLNLLTFDYMETFYNTARLHSSLNYHSPLDFEHALQSAGGVSYEGKPGNRSENTILLDTETGKTWILWPTEGTPSGYSWIEVTQKPEAPKAK